MKLSKKLFLSGIVLFVLLSSSFVSVGFSLVIWTKTYGGEGDQSASSIIETSDGGFALAGRTFSPEGSYQTTDFWVLKTDVHGIPEFPSWAILPILLIVGLAVVFAKKKYWHRGDT